MLGKNHPETLAAVMNMAIVYKTQKDYGEAEEMYQRALKGYEAQLGKDHTSTKNCTRSFKNCLEKAVTAKGLRN